MSDSDPAGNAAALAVAKERLGIVHGPSHRWGDWNLTGHASEHKAMMARFRVDHPQENLPWGYCPP